MGNNNASGSGTLPSNTITNPRCEARAITTRSELGYLKNDLFQELLEMAEEEYGLQRDGPIRLPLRADFMQYTISHIERTDEQRLEEEFV
ncbi:auxin responsive SAUR protein [Tanacetum coccineum]|uniref:Auxin responsive SAUR protein n=1 Tax=Tanacetum coccineum TaxID=301880 RepID=A0ABQ5D3S3_9ASTR